MLHQIGDIIILEGTGDFSEGIECIVMEVSPQNGRVTKMKAATHDDRLGKMGFISEGDDWVAIEYDLISPN